MRGLGIQVASLVAERVDRAFGHFAFRSRRASESGASETSAERVDEAARFYGPGADERMFPQPQVPRLSERPRRRLRGGDVVDITWASAWKPLHPDYTAFAAKFPVNHAAAARWLRHQQVSPAVIFLHGWGGGYFAFNERESLTRRLYGAGADVVIAALPFHGPRSPRRLGRPLFPSTDPIRTNEGFAQAVSDVRALAAALRARGAPAVAVMGRSLGGFTSALLATVEPGFDAVVPVIPFGSFPELIWEQGEGTAGRQRAANAGLTFERFAAAFAATTPLQRKLQVSPSSVFLIAGKRDRVTPLRHAMKLRDHFSSAVGGEVRLETFPGGHLLQAGKGPALNQMLDFLRTRGVIRSA